MYARSVPFCAGILSIGIGTSGNRIGIGSGMIPNGAYLAHSSATRASIGIAGKRQAAEVLHVHHLGQVLAGDGDGAARALAAGLHFDVRHHAVEQRLRLCRST